MVGILATEEGRALFALGLSRCMHCGASVAHLFWDEFVTREGRGTDLYCVECSRRWPWS